MCVKSTNKSNCILHVYVIYSYTYSTNTYYSGQLLDQILNKFLIFKNLTIILIAVAILVLCILCVRTCVVVSVSVWGCPRSVLVEAQAVGCDGRRAVVTQRG